MNLDYMHGARQKLHIGEQGMFDLAMKSRILDEAARGTLTELRELMAADTSESSLREGILRVLAYAFTTGVSYAVAQLGAKEGAKPTTGSILGASGVLDELAERRRQKL